MDICVFGAGSLGSLLGGMLAPDHEVTLVGRAPHVERVRESGLRLTGALEEQVRPRARTEPPPGGDLALVTVKSFDTPAAARVLGERSFDAVCSLQNGMGNERVLAERLETVLAGTCTYGARMPEPGVVECTGVGEVVLGAPGGGTSSAAERVGQALATGLETTDAADMPRRLWEKLAVNAGINAVTALARLPNGALVEGPGEPLARAAAAETQRVARTTGVDLEGAPERAISVAETTAANSSSMRQDVEAGRRTEIDAINGYVLDRAENPVPVNATLARLVRSWERERGLRG